MPDEVVISDAELAAMAASAGLAQEYVSPLLLDYLRGEIDRVALETQPSLYNAILNGLTGPADPKAMAAAQNLAKRQAETLARGLVETQLNAMGQVVADGIAAGLHPHEIARNLDMVKGLDSGRAATMRDYVTYLDGIDPPLTQTAWERRLESQYQKLLADRKRVIAETETRYATGEANRLEAESRGAKFQAWMTVGDDRVSDVCRNNEAAGWIGLKDKYPSGHQTPPAHPRCRCTIAYRTAEPDEAAKNRAAQRAEATAKAKEQAQEAA